MFFCRFFDSYRVRDYARSGNKASQTVIIEEGPIPEFSHSMEPQLRQLGLPTTLNKGSVSK
jgi:mRNA turnover protein 4